MTITVKLVGSPDNQPGEKEGVKRTERKYQTRSDFRLCRPNRDLPSPTKEEDGVTAEGSGQGKGVKVGFRRRKTIFPRTVLLLIDLYQLNCEER